MFVFLKFQNLVFTTTICTYSSRRTLASV